MNKHSFEIEVAAATAADADKKMAALTTLLAKLSTTELEKLAHVVKHEPGKMALAKKALGV